MNDENIYKLEVSLNVFRHLGLNLYSNVPAVLSELVANAWDAEAKVVSIVVDGQDEKTITIQDDGCGMDKDDLNDKFLKIGYQRREDKNAGQDFTPNLQRKVMGRKGIGKLSVFSISDEIKVYTKKKNRQLHAIELSSDGIEEAINKQKNYYPKPINSPQDEIEGTGTKIILSKLKKKVNKSIDRNLKKRIARRFDIMDADFEVKFNGDTITYEDTEYFDKLEFAYVYGQYDADRLNLDKERVEEREKNTVSFTPEYGSGSDQTESVSGWIGLARSSGSLQLENGDNINKVSILSRGKVALEDILGGLGERGLYTKYVIGQINADFLDDTKQDDISTSSRQGFIEDDPRFMALRDFIHPEFKALGIKRNELKEAEGVKKATEIPAVEEWFEQLKGDRRKLAKRLFGKINQIIDPDNLEERKTLLKYAVLAFENLQYRDKLSELERIDISNLEAVIQVFSELDDIEAFWYHQITHERLEVIQKLRKCVESDEIERIIQKHVCDHLWLLDPSWDRATENPEFEKTVKAGFDKISDKLTKNQERYRIDIRYKKTSGVHVIIELKRPSVETSTSQVMEQLDRYINSLRKQLDANQESNPVIQAVCLVGKSLSDWENNLQREQESADALKAKHIRVITYQKLLKDAENSYKSYLEKYSERGRINDTVEAIEQYQPNARTLG